MFSNSIKKCIFTSQNSFFPIPAGSRGLQIFNWNFNKKPLTYGSPEHLEDMMNETNIMNMGSFLKKKNSVLDLVHIDKLISQSTKKEKNIHKNMKKFIKDHNAFNSGLITISIGVLPVVCFFSMLAENSAPLMSYGLSTTLVFSGGFLMYKGMDYQTNKYHYNKQQKMTRMLQQYKKQNRFTYAERKEMEIEKEKDMEEKEEIKTK